MNNLRWLSSLFNGRNNRWMFGNRRNNRGMIIYSSLLSVSPISEIRASKAFKSRALKSSFGRQHYRLIKKEKSPFCHSVRVASALNGPITTVCTANAYIP